MSAVVCFGTKRQLKDAEAKDLTLLGPPSDRFVVHDEWRWGRTVAHTGRDLHD